MALCYFNLLQLCHYFLFLFSLYVHYICTYSKFLPTLYIILFLFLFIFYFLTLRL